MNVYEPIFREISAADWELFAVDVLQEMGFEVLLGPAVGPDGGSDALLQRGEVRYILSCKHRARPVGTGVESSILDRVRQHGAQGFIGFYSGPVTQSLQTRLQRLNEDGTPCEIYDRKRISGLLADGSVPARIAQKYASPRGAFLQHSPPDEYRPLSCPECGRDILDDEHIPWSAAGIARNAEGAWEYVYGHKLTQFAQTCERVDRAHPWIELTQALHLEQLLRWHALVDYLIAEQPVAPTFWPDRHRFESHILQRLVPPNWGTWL